MSPDWRLHRIVLPQTFTTSYRYYRLNITANNGGSSYPIQLSEFALLSSPTDVGDKTPPVLTLPSNMTLSASNSTGMIVTFSATATDVVSGTLNVICEPASGSLFSPGTTTVQCSATDLLANTATGSFNITVNSPLMTWRQQYFGTTSPADNAADNADPDGDGINNKLEFFLAGNPSHADATSILPTLTVPTSGPAGFVYEFNRLKSASSMSYTVEYKYSLDLASWTPAVDGDGGVTIVTTSHDTNSDHVTVTIPTSQQKVFVRLRL